MAERRDVRQIAREAGSAATRAGTSARHALDRMRRPGITPPPPPGPIERLLERVRRGEILRLRGRFRGRGRTFRTYIYECSVRLLLWLPELAQGWLSGFR